MTHLDSTRTDVPPAPGENASTGVVAGTPSPWPVFWVAAIAVFLVAMDGTMLFAAFSALRAGFPQATPADLSWVLNAYTVVYAAMLIPSGGWRTGMDARRYSSPESGCSWVRPSPAALRAPSNGWWRRGWRKPSGLPC